MQKENERIFLNRIYDCEKKIQAITDSISLSFENIEKLQSCINVLSSHIYILEKRNKKFTDRFKFGRFKFKSINDEEFINKNIKEFKEKRISFSLNDD